MYLIERLQQLERLDALIRRKGTGNREALASRLEVSSRTVANLLNDLKLFGAEIAYCRERRTYYYETPIVFSFNPVQEKEQTKLMGGRAYYLTDYLTVANLLPRQRLS